MAQDNGLFDGESFRSIRETHARYMLEHDVLPDFFYSMKKDSIQGFLGMLSHEPGEFLSHIYNDLRAEFANHDQSVRQTEYAPTDYSSMSFVGPDEIIPEPDVVIIRVNMPHPERPLLCARAYFCCSGKDYSKRQYYTVEKLEILPHEKKAGVPQADCVLCGWEPEERKGSGGSFFGIKIPRRRSKDDEGQSLAHFNTGIEIFSGVNPRLREQVLHVLKEEYSQEKFDELMKYSSIVVELGLIHSLFVKGSPKG